MVLVRRGNVELEVHEDFVKQYLSKGFDIIDANTGKIVEKGTANNFNSLQLAFVELTKENKKILVENLMLKKEVDTLKKKLEQASKKGVTKSDKE